MVKDRLEALLLHQQINMQETLTDNQQRFFALLEEFPRISVHWDRTKVTLDRESLKRDLLGMSSGESALARFFASLWEGKNTFEFDIFQHIPDCDEPAKGIILAWLTNPFFP